MDDENRSLEFYQCLSDTLLEILNAQLLTPKEFSNHFIELITTKIYRFSEKPNDYGTKYISKNKNFIKLFKFIVFSIQNIRLYFSFGQI